MPSYVRPARLNEALQLLSRGDTAILAGGTDYFPALPRGKASGTVVDITAVAGLRGIRAGNSAWRIGATTTWTDLIEARLPPYLDALKRAAHEVGGVQIQNAGTIAGNLCNASPAADGVPALLALDASVELTGSRGKRVLRIDEFILGPRKTSLGRGELLTAILIPKPVHPARSTFLKLGARRYLLISIAMVAAALESRRGSVLAARVAVGSCSAVARRLPALETALAGRKLDSSIGECVQPEMLSALTPIDDVRANGRYRREAALELVRRALRGLA